MVNGLFISYKLIPIFAYNICTPPSQKLIIHPNKPTKRTSTKANKNKVQAQNLTRRKSSTSACRCFLCNCKKGVCTD